MALQRHGRAFMAGAALLSAMALMAGCSGSGSADANSSSSAAGASPTEDPTATITFMEAMSSGTQQSALKELVNRFQQAHPTITVNLEEQPDYGTLHTKITAQTAAGQPPTIAQVYPNWAAEYADSGVIDDLEDRVASAADYSKLYTGVQNDLKLTDGKTWLWPFNKSVDVIYRNPNLVPNASATWDDFATAAKAASTNGVTALSIDPGSSSGPATGTAFFEILAESFGDAVFADDGTPQFTNPGVVKAMEYLVDLKKAGALSLGTNYPGQTALGGQTGAFDVSTVASYPFNLKAVGDKFDMQVDQIPAGTAKQANQLGGTDIALFSDASDDEKTAAWEFMQFLTSADSQAYWAEQTGYLPVNKDSVNVEGFSDYAAKNPFVTEATKQLDTASPLPAASWVDQSAGLLAVAIQDCVNQGADPTAELQNAQDQALQLQKDA